MVVEARFMRNRFSRILGASGELKSFWAMKRSREADLSLLLCMNLGLVSSTSFTGLGEPTPRSVAFAACCAFALGFGFPPRKMHC